MTTTSALSPKRVAELDLTSRAAPPREPRRVALGGHSRQDVAGSIVIRITDDAGADALDAFAFCEERRALLVTRSPHAGVVEEQR